MSRLFKLMLMGFGALFLLICLVGVIAAIFAIAFPPAIGNFAQASHMGMLPHETYYTATPTTGVAMGGSLMLLLGGLLIPLLLILLLFFLMRAGKKSNQSGAMNEQETRIMQEIHQGLTRMEERVEALETLLLTSRNG